MRSYGFLSLLSVISSLLASGCGYTLQTSRNPLADREGVRRIYVSPLTNNTYKAGVENLVYNALVKKLSAQGRVKVVQAPELSDAVLSGSINTATSSGQSSTRADFLNPAGRSTRTDIYVNTEYSALLDCSFSLIRRNPPPGKNGTIWTSRFSRNKRFPASNQVGTLGTTSALINDSEFDRALSDLATSMMSDVHESMLAIF